MNIAALRSRIGYQAALLGAVALLASAALEIAHRQTRVPIAAAEARDLQDSLAQVLPEGSFDNDLLADAVHVTGSAGPVEVYRAFKDGRLQAVVFRGGARGYAGPIDLVMGVDLQGRVLGVRVTRHTETPGLGDKIEVAKDDWIRDFEGKSLGSPPAERWQVKKDGGAFDQFAGATITPRAVVKAVREGLAFFTAHRDAIRTAPAGAGEAQGEAHAQADRGAQQ